MSLWGAITGIIKAPFIFVANMWDTWSDVSGATAWIFAIGGGIIGGLIAGGKGAGNALSGVIAGALGGLAASVGLGVVAGAASGGYEAVKNVATDTFGGDDEEVAEGHGLPDGAGAGRDGSQGRAAS